MRETFFHEVFEAMWNVSPLLKKIQVKAQSEGTNSSYEREDGKTVEVTFEALKVERAVKSDDARGLTPEAFIDTAHGMGTEMGQGMLKNLLSSVSAVCDEVGNVVDCEGGKITFAKFVELLSKVQFEFDEHGSSRVKDFLLDPKGYEQLCEAMEEWKADPEKRAAIETVVQLKREEYNEREARRRMVD